MIDPIEKTIRDAIAQRKTVIIKYDKSSDEIDKEIGRETEPYDIKFNENTKQKYYWGYDVRKGGIRCFKMNYISGAKQTEESFAPRFEMKL